jgi:hypothetical protein
MQVSGFLHSFSDVFGLRPTPSVDQLARVSQNLQNRDLLHSRCRGYVHRFAAWSAVKHDSEPRASQFLTEQAIEGGSGAPLLGAVHIALMRLLQADMEESHASGATAVRAEQIGCTVLESLLAAAGVHDSGTCCVEQRDLSRAESALESQPLIA